MLKSCLGGAISSLLGEDLQRLCSERLQRAQEEHSQAGIDYSSDMLAELKALYAAVSELVCNFMVEEGAWDLPEEQKPRELHLPGTQAWAGDEARGQQGLPLSQGLARHLLSVYATPEPRAPRAGRPCRLWPSVFGVVGRIPTAPDSAEVQSLYREPVDFTKLLRTAGHEERRTSIERNSRAVENAEEGLRLAAVSTALAQFKDRALAQVASRVGEAINSLTSAQGLPPQAEEALDLLNDLPDLLQGSFMANWATNYAAMASADALARQVVTAVKAVRTDTCKVLLGDSCPQHVVDRLTGVPVKPGSRLLFGGRLTSEFSHLAQGQREWQLVSSALDGEKQRADSTAKAASSSSRRRAPKYKPGAFLAAAESTDPKVAKLEEAQPSQQRPAASQKQQAARSQQPQGKQGQGKPPQGKQPFRGGKRSRNRKGRGK